MSHMFVAGLCDEASHLRGVRGQEGQGSAVHVQLQAGPAAAAGHVCQSGARMAGVLETVFSMLFFSTCRIVF